MKGPSSPFSNAITDHNHLDVSGGCGGDDNTPDSVFADLALDLAFHTSLSIQTSHSSYMTLSSSAQYPQPHPLILPEILDRIFRSLRRRRCLYPCLFVCKEWYAQATIVMWEAPSFDGLEQFITFSRCFINLSDVADHARHHIVRRAATWRDRGLISLLGALSSDAKTFVTGAYKLVFEDDAVVNSLREGWLAAVDDGIVKAVYGSLESHDSNTLSTGTPLPIRFLRRKPSTVILRPDPIGDYNLPWPAQWVAGLSLKAVMTVLSGASGAGKLIRASQSFSTSLAAHAPDPSRLFSNPIIDTAFSIPHHLATAAASLSLRAQNRLGRVRGVVDSLGTSVIHLFRNPALLPHVFRRPYLPRFSCPTGPLIRTLHIHRLSTLTDALLIPCLRACPSLIHLELYACDQVGDESIMIAAKSCPRLRHLIVPGCGRVSDVSAKVVARFSRLLETWDVRSCPRITDVGVEAVVSRCNDLSHLNLGRTSFPGAVTSRSLIALAEAPCLREISCIGLTGCGVTDTGLLALLLDGAAPVLKKRRVVEVVNVEVATGPTVLLAPAAEGVLGDGRTTVGRGRAPKLRRLSLNFCPIGDLAIEIIAEECTQLRVLEIKGCQQVRSLNPLCRMTARGVRIECSPELKKKINEAMDITKNAS